MKLSVNIEKRLGSFHLKVETEVETEVLALLGASGCGKSMTLKSIAGIERPDKGRILLDDRVLFDSEKKINISPQKRKIGYLFQQYALFPNMTVEQNIACGIYRRKHSSTVGEMIEKMHLNGMEKKYPRQLSGGQQQRAALARILISEPDVLLLDEPFSALDSHLRYQMEQEVRDIIREFGKPVILVSHDRDEVFRLSDRVAVMNDGNIEVQGIKKQIFSSPGTVNGALLTGYRNISAARQIAPGRVYAEDWMCELDVREASDQVGHIGVRTESVILGGTENTVRCHVDEVIANPFSYTVMVSPESLGRPTDQPESIDELGHATAGKVTFELTVSKPKWESVKSEHVIVSIPKDSIVLLK